MYSILVLGLIPGTNIQISFWAWLAILALAVLSFRRYKNQFRHHFKRLAPYLLALIELGKAPSPRLPLPASRLHRRTPLTAR